MRLLLLNSNTSQFVTDKVTAEARRVALPDTEIVPATGSFGARVMTTRSEVAIGEHATLDALAQHAAGCDAVVIAVSYDSALSAAREMVGIPVVGITEAALLTACMLGSKVGIVVFGRRVLPLYQEVVSLHGMDARVAGWRVVDSNSPYGQGDQADADRLTIAAANDLVERDYAEVVILAGAVMAGVPLRLQDQVAVPLLDGVSCAVPQAETLVRLARPKARTGSLSALPKREVVGLSPALSRYFNGDQA
ncbi:MAG: aspartate/glutamate racemase family protein [Moraxellaceae bacterium]|nr:aspartate/glutamate racemase family protein [Moraxellaceae bacterium]